MNFFFVPIIKFKIFRYSSDSKCHDCTQPRDVEEIDSELVCGVVERVAEGRLAVSTAADCASRFINDGSSKACMCFCFFRIFKFE